MNIKEVLENPYAQGVLAICTIAAFIFGIYTWVVGKKRKEISYCVNTYTIVEGGNSIIPELQLFYEDKKIDNIANTKIAIWNSGNSVLSKEDIATAKPLKIIVNSDDAEILDAQIVTYSEESNMFAITKKDVKNVQLKFDYMEVHQGVVLQLLHTGTKESIGIECKVKGGKELKNVNKSNAKKKKNKTKMTITMILLGIDVVLISFLGLVSLLADWGIITEEELSKIMNLPENTITKTIKSILLIGSVIMLFLMFFNILRKVYRFDIPLCLRKSIEHEE